MRSLATAVLLFSALSLLAMAAPFVAADLSAKWADRAGTLAWMRNQPPGSKVTLDAMMIDEIGDGFLIVREPFDQKQKVRVQAYARVKKWQSVEVTGTVTAGQSSEMYLSNARVFAYTDGKGRVILVPFPKLLDLAQGWPYKVDVTSDTPIPAEPQPPPQQMDVQGGTIGSAKLEANGTSVQLEGKIVTAVFPPSGTDRRFFYIEEPDRSSGIKVLPPAGVWVERGWIVTVTGVVQGGESGPAECCILASEVNRTGFTTIPGPLGTNGRATAGGEFGLQRMLYLKTPQNEEQVGCGLNPVGLRVTVWGRLLQQESEGAHTVYWIDDGSGLKRTTDNGLRTGLKVVSWYGCVEPHYHQQDPDYVSAVGILGAEMSADDPPVPAPVVRVPCEVQIPEQCPVRVKWNSPYPSDGTTWDRAYQTVQEGIDAAFQRGCEVWVAGNSDNPYEERITMKSGVRVYGGFAGWESQREERDWNANETILDGADGGSVVRAENLTAPAGIDGFTIRNGGADFGGGVYCLDSDLTIANNRIRSNGTTGYGGGGGGIYCSGEDGEVSIWSNTIGADTKQDGNQSGWNDSGAGIYCDNCAANIVGNAIKNNTAGFYGGGVFCTGSPAPTLRDNQISLNETEYGGGISTVDSSPTISENEVFENSGMQSGGGVYCSGGAPVISHNVIRANTGLFNNGGGVATINSSPTISENTIRENTALFGGGIYGVGGTPVILGNTILANQAGYEGGGIGCDADCPAQIIANHFEDNDAYDHGGGISLEDGSNAYIANNLFIRNHADAGFGGGGVNVYGITSATIVNNTFVQNTAELGSGGAVVLRVAGYGLLINNIFAGNVAVQGNSVAATQAGAGSITYCLAYPGDGDANYYAETGSTLNWSSATNLYAAPLFCGTAAHPYWLQAGSPARQTGLVGSPAPEADMDGRPRPGDDALTDIGAYEDNPSCD